MCMLSKFKIEIWSAQHDEKLALKGLIIYLTTQKQHCIAVAKSVKYKNQLIIFAHSISHSILVPSI